MNNQPRYLSLVVPEGHRTCVVPYAGKEALAAFSREYGTGVCAVGPKGIIDDIRTPEDLRRALEPLHGEPVIIDFEGGGLAFLDHMDDFLILIVPACIEHVVRAAIDVDEAFEDAIDERDSWFRLRVESNRLEKLDEILAVAIHTQG